MRSPTVPRASVHRRGVVGFAVLLVVAANRPSGAADVDYLRDVKPLLAEKCVSCHGPIKQEAGLRLDVATLIRQGSESGLVIATERVDDSPLLHRITAADDERMPPAEEGERLTPAQIETLRAWIAAGLPAPADEPVLASPKEHWAFQPIRRPALPLNHSTGFVEDNRPSIPDAFKASGMLRDHTVDALVKLGHQAAGVQPLPPADPLTLLRRVSLDLTGLPPSESDVRTVLADPDGWSYEQTVERLLAAPQYGERWGRHWMDVWRYSDWDGYKDELRSSQRHIWHWRDWIIESLNEDKPYDRMIVEMLAGDEVAPEDPNVLRATGFLARNYHNSNRDIWLDATVEDTLKAFLGVTANCARCHDHKYDPIPQQEYYALRAIFEPYRVRTERLPGEPDLMKAGLPRVYDADLDAPTYVYLRGDEKHPDKEYPVAAAALTMLDLPLEIEAVHLPAGAGFPSLAEHIEREDLAAAEEQVKQARESLTKVRKESGDPVPRCESRHSVRPPAPRSSFRIPQSVEQAQLKLCAAKHNLDSLRLRWAADKAKHQDASIESDAVSRMSREAAQAERLSSMTSARSDAYEKWSALQTVLGMDAADAAKRTGAIDKATKDLAASDTALAKAAAALAIDDAKYTPVGPAYPKTSTGRRLALARWITRPDNPLTARVAANYVWMWHFDRPLVDNVFDFGLQTPRPVQAELLDFLAAELIDSGWSLKHLHRLILTSETYRRASSGDSDVMAHDLRLDPENRRLWRANIVRLDAEAVRDSVLAAAGRLDLTLGGPDLDEEAGEAQPRRSLYFRHAYEKQMTMLVLFDAASPTECYRRPDSITPQQALVLSNSELSRSMARRLAQELSQQSSEPGAFVENAFVRVLCRPPTDDEVRACLAFLNDQPATLGESGGLTTFAGGGKASVPASDDPLQRARENLVHVLMNHNDFVTVR